MFIKLRAERFKGRLTAQERGAGLGDIFTQNTLSAIRAVCQVLGLSLCGRGTGRGEGRLKGGERTFSVESATPTSSWTSRVHAVSRTRPEHYAQEN